MKEQYQKCKKEDIKHFKTFEVYKIMGLGT